MIRANDDDGIILCLRTEALKTNKQTNNHKQKTTIAKFTPNFPFSNNMIT